MIPCILTLQIYPHVCFRLLIATLQEFIEALRRLKLEVKTQREETMLLRKALEDCEACKIKKPECTDTPYPCFEGPPRVDCRDTVDGTQCGPCPPGYKVDTCRETLFSFDAAKTG